MLYKFFLKPILFRFDAEKVHHWVTFCLKLWLKIPLAVWLTQKMYRYKNTVLVQNLMDLTFENPVGLAAGFDKNADLIDELACLGFGFIEIGTLTPQAQEGNPKPRLFRLTQDEALINRMGFNNTGVAKAVQNLKKRKKKIIVGGNIGKNKITPNELAHQDYMIAFEALFLYVDYFVVNVSSPNTPNLRALQEKEPLEYLLKTLQESNLKKDKPKPILLKISPDLSFEQLEEVIAIVLENQLAGIVATNTTLDRTNLRTTPHTLDDIGLGGLSGKPLAQKSTEMIRYIRQKAGKNLIIIGVGGIDSPQSALEKIEAGANLVQLYTGFVYEGPGIIKKINKAIVKKVSVK